MKKFLFIFAAIFGLLFCATSCKDSTFSFEYAFTIDGNADGNVSVMFPGGDLEMKGGSELEFNYSSANMDAVFYKNMPSYTLEELKASGRPNYVKVARLVESNYEAQFKAASADGNYYLHVVGVVRERLTGIEVRIDKTLSSKEPSTLEGDSQ